MAGPCSWSNHHIVSFTVSHIGLSPATSGWHLNDSLLTDLVAKFSDHKYFKYFNLSNLGDIPTTSLWAAHKVVIWGHLIEPATEKERRKLADVTRLMQEWHKLYHLHS